MEITITDLQKKIPLRTKRIKTIVQKILNYLGIEESVLSIVFVSSQKIRALNKKFLNRTHATDVLAFDLGGNGSPVKKNNAKHAKEIIGDVIVSTDAARQNARKFKTSVSQEIVLYVTHGILHLLGYDDHKKADVDLMRKRENEIMTMLGSLVHGAVKDR